MLYHLLITVGAILVFMVGWWLVQLLVRRNSPGIADDCDILEDKMSCRSCGKGDSCSKFRP